MKKLSKEKRDKIILIAVGTVMVAVGVYYGLISLQKEKYAKHTKAIMEEEAKVGNGKRLIQSTAEMQRRLELATAALNEIEKGMATGDMYSWIIQKVNQFKKGYRVDIPQFSREVTGDVSILPRFPYRAATFTVRGTARFHDFGRFLAGFENEFPFIRVQNLQLSPAESKSVTGANMAPEELSFRMELVTLINPQN